MYLSNFDRFFSHLQWQIILTTAQIADDMGLRAFAVGGIVRDAIYVDGINGRRSPFFPKDLDLVFDGEEHAGIKVAIALHELFPESKLQIHDKFQTAELLWQDFAIDMATARREIYAYAGANPQVMATHLEEDLGRRDFTINALAVQLDPKLGTKGEIIDRFHGLQDLANKQVRTIRQGSFAEDPRRLFRAVRFAIRLDLAIAPETHAEIMTTTASGLHDAIGGARLRSELLYTLAEPRASKMFELLQKLGILRCIHPDLRLVDDFGRQWRRSQYWLKLIHRLELKAQSSVPLPIKTPVQLGLELLLSYLPPEIVSQIALGLTPEQKTRQAKLAGLLLNLQNLSSDLTHSSFKISEITQNLQKFDTQTLILAGAKCELTQRRILWHYLTQWQRVKSPLTGADLKQLGYATGKHMGELLEQLRWAALDGEIKSKGEAIAMLQKASMVTIK